MSPQKYTGFVPRKNLTTHRRTLLLQPKLSLKAQREDKDSALIIILFKIYKWFLKSSMGKWRPTEPSNAWSTMAPVTENRQKCFPLPNWKQKSLITKLSWVRDAVCPSYFLFSCKQMFFCPNLECALTVISLKIIIEDTQKDKKVGWRKTHTFLFPLLCKQQ